MKEQIDRALDIVDRLVVCFETWISRSDPENLAKMMEPFKKIFEEMK